MHAAPKRGLLAVEMALLVAAPARAVDFTNSPSVVGDNARVNVNYDQRVNNTTAVKKTFVIYEGPKAAEVIASLERFIVDHDATRQALEDGRDAEAFV